MSDMGPQRAAPKSVPAIEAERKQQYNSVGEMMADVYDYDDLKVAFAGTWHDRHEVACKMQQRDAENARLRAFVKRIYESPDTPAWAHDAAAKLLGLPSLAHGCDGEKEVEGDS